MKQLYYSVVHVMLIRVVESVLHIPNGFHLCMAKILESFERLLKLLRHFAANDNPTSVHYTHKISVGDRGSSRDIKVDGLKRSHGDIS